MTLEEIHEHTLSKGITTANAVYRVTKDTISEEISTGINIRLRDGDLLAISGCGSLNENTGHSYFQYLETWVRVDNDAVEHYANEVLEKVKS